MKVIRYFFIIFFITATVSYSSQEELLIIGEEFIPFEFQKGKDVVGIDIDIITHVFNKLNIPFKVRILPWKRAWMMAERGLADAILSTSRKKEREPYLFYPKNNMWESEVVFFTSSKKFIFDFKGYETAVNENLKIGIVRGNSYNESFWKAFPYKDGTTIFKIKNNGLLNNKLEEVFNIKLNLKKIAKGRIDLFPCDKIIGLHTAINLNLQNKITFYKKILYTKSYPMPFTKNSKYNDIENIAKKFDNELGIFKKTEQYKKIFQKWTN